MQKWTKITVFEESRKYETKVQFKKNSAGAYSAALKNGWMKEISWFKKPIPWRLKWTREAVFAESKKYDELKAFIQKGKGAYTVARVKGWLEEMTWLKRAQITRGFWKNKDNVLQECHKYNTMKDFRAFSYAAYNSAKENGWLEEMTWLEKDKQMPPGYWQSKNNVFTESHKYISTIDFMRGSIGAYNSARRNGWLDEMKWLIRRHKKRGFWDVKENVFAEAIKYKYKSDFARLGSSAYTSALKHHWLEEMHWFQHKSVVRAPKGPIHCIYVYEDETNKFAYVGATNDIKRRDIEHRREHTDPVFKHFNSIGVEIPQCKILMERLTIEERQREERKHSLYYRDVLNYKLLNDPNRTGESVGSIGSLAWKWTKTNVIKEAEKYETPKEFLENAAGAYDAALKYKMMNEETFPWFYSKKRPQGWWNIKEHVFLESKKYKTWNEFFWNCPAAYNAAKKLKCEDEMTWLTRDQAPQGYYQKEQNVIEESRKYTSRKAFHDGCHAAYDYAKKNNLWEKMPWITMSVKENGFWTKERVFNKSKQYVTRSQFKSQASTAYGKAVKYKWIDEMTWLVSETVPRGFWQDKDNVMKEGHKYNSRNEFRWGNPSAYRAAIDNRWIDEMTWLKRPRNYNQKWTKEVVLKKSKNYTTRGEFKKELPSAYKVALYNGWLEEMVWLSSIRKK